MNDKEKLAMITTIIMEIENSKIEIRPFHLRKVLEIKKILDSTIWQNSVAQLVVKFSMTKK